MLTDVAGDTVAALAVRADRRLEGRCVGVSAELLYSMRRVDPRDAMTLDWSLMPCISPTSILRNAVVQHQHAFLTFKAARLIPSAPTHRLRRVGPSTVVLSCVSNAIIMFEDDTKMTLFVHLSG